MKTLATLEPLTTRLLEIQRINSAASVLSWDQETYMPAGGGEARAEQIAPRTRIEPNAPDETSAPGIVEMAAGVRMTVLMASATATAPMGFTSEKFFLTIITPAA